MKTRIAWGGAILAGVLVWVASDELRWPVRLFISLLLGPAPIVFFAQAHAANNLPRPLPRISIYVGSIMGLVLLGVGAWLAARLSGFSAESLGFVRVSPASFIAWTIALTVGAGAIVAIFRALHVRESAIMREIVPVTAAERAVFVLLCVAAGVFEEIAFRSVLLPALDQATGSTAVAVAVSSLAFGVLHAHQNTGGALRAALLGLLLAVAMVISGSVYASMAAHTLVDLIGGLLLARWLFR